MKHNRLMLFFLAVLLMLISFTYGVYSVRKQNAPFKLVRSFYQLFAEPRKEGIWRPIRTEDVTGLTDEQKKALEQVGTLPYLTGYNPASEESGVIVHDEALAHQGINFVVSSDGPNAYIIDMKGNELHEWRKPFEDVWHEAFDLDVGASELSKQYWKRARPLPDGGLLAIYTDFGLIKLDMHSNVVWARKGGFHHDLFVNADGNIYILTHKFNREHGLNLDASPIKDKVLEDYISILSPDGERIEDISVLECIRNSKYAPMLEHIKASVDIFHTNTVRRIRPGLSGRYPMFNPEHLLISMREIHAIAIVDPVKQNATWLLTGMWNFQHEPRISKDGNLLVFDNRGNDGRSQAIEIDPLTHQVVWSYGAGPGESFYTEKAGTLERLPNDNTLITESEAGRCFEVTPDGRIVWEYINPNRAGENDELIASLYDVIRLAPEFFDEKARGAMSLATD